MKLLRASGLLGLLVVVFLVAAWRALPGWVERTLEAAIASEPGWTAEIGGVELDLLGARAVVRDLRADTDDGRKVLESVELPVAHVSWTWAGLRDGVLALEVVAERPVVRIGTKQGPRRRRERPVPAPPRWHVTIDAVAVDGTFLYVDENTDPVARVALSPVNGTIEGLGTLPGPARFDLVAEAPGGGRIAFDGRMDFFNAHLDAFDLLVTFDGLDATAFPEAARAYLGTSFASGTLDGRFGLTLDEGRRELLPDTPMFGGAVDDLAVGGLRLDLVGTDVIPTDPSVERLVAGRVALSAVGAPVGDAPLTVRGAVDGLDARVTRAWIDALGDAPAEGDAVGLPPFRLESLDLRGRLTFVDDWLDPPVAITAEQVAVRLRDEGGFASVAVDASVRGARVEATGTVSSVDGRRPDVALRGRLVGLDARAIHHEVDAYLGALVDRGTIDAVADVRAGPSGVTGEVMVTVEDVRFAESGWTIAADRAVLDFLDGEGTAEGIAIDPDPGGALQHITADRAEVSWSPERLREGKVVATIDAWRPTVVVLERPGSGRRDRAAGGKVPWSLDLLTTDGTVVWHDPVADPQVEVAIEEVDGSIRRLGTLYATSLWDLTGELPGGGHVQVDAEMDPVGSHPDQPWRLDVSVRDASLTALQDQVIGYVGRRIFATGTADADLSIDWAPAVDGHRDANGTLRLAGRDLEIADPPLDAIGLDELALDVRWDPASDEPYHLVGRARGVDVLASRGGSLPSSDEVGALAGYLDDLPPFRVERFDVTDGELRYRDHAGRVPVDLVASDLALTLYDLQNVGARRATLVASGRIAGGTIGGRISVAPMRTPADFHVDAELRDVPAVALNDALRAWADLDVERGRIGVVASVDATDGLLSGELRAVLDQVAVLQWRDLKRPKGFLRSLGIGVLVNLVDHEGVATVTFPVEGTVTHPHIGVVRGLTRAVGRALGIGVRADADAFGVPDLTGPED